MLKVLPSPDHQSSPSLYASCPKKCVCVCVILLKDTTSIQSLNLTAKLTEKNITWNFHLSVNQVTTRKPLDHRKEVQTAVVWSCLPFIRSGQNHLARHSERGTKTRQTEERGGKTNIREWTDLEFTKSQWAVENRGKWRKLVVKSSVVPQ